MGAVLEGSVWRKAISMRSLFLVSDVSRIKSWTQHTQVLDILVGKERYRSLFSIAGPKTRFMCFVDHNTIRGDCREEGKTVGGLSPARVVVEGDIG